jgi:hypothetical protein
MFLFLQLKVQDEILPLSLLLTSKQTLRDLGRKSLRHDNSNF